MAIPATSDSAVQIIPSGLGIRNEPDQSRRAAAHQFQAEQKRRQLSGPGLF